ncbi:TDT family transporter [Polycladidibacter hongkongensis]|uniref:TDT family transporter n=1 Tax=Polycladidibacter hongkongensis TaxID=1647556 RepID=UPI00082C1B24|nr:TDT family transporter [Pseudovibrio hongkongensis]
MPAKQHLSILPTPLSGVALALAALGWVWEAALGLSGVMQFSGALTAALLLFALALKFGAQPLTFLEDLRHPATGAVLPTFAMAMLIIANVLFRFHEPFAIIVWWAATALHLLFFALFVIYRVRAFALAQVTPLWFIPPVGILVAVLVFPFDQTSHSLANEFAHYLLIFGGILFVAVLPLVLYRLVKLPVLPEPLRPTLGLMGAPASLLLAAYLHCVSQPDAWFVLGLLLLALALNLWLIMQLPRLLFQAFTPALSALTFPLVICASCLFRVGSWSASHAQWQTHSEALTALAFLQLFVATCVIAVVVARYISNHRRELRQQPA